MSDTSQERVQLATGRLQQLNTRLQTLQSYGLGDHGGSMFYCSTDRQAAWCHAQQHNTRHAAQHAC
jgi:hypothetical protein